MGGMDPAKIRKLLESTHLLRKPKKLLSTFGITRIQYHLVSPLDDLPERTRLRKGWVVSERPKILTPQALRDRFKDFGEDAGEFADWLAGQYQDFLRGLEYSFRNRDLQTSVLAENAHRTALLIRDDVDARDIAQAAVIECPDAAWSLALMRFTLEESARSFPTNVNDLDLHGMFEPGSNEARRRRNEIERLFERAGSDSGTRKSLAVTLRRYGLFEEYEDRFLALYR
ncbi:MAG: hypothetical protein ABII00_08300 [Elusimicrobiota bacterium]